ncbi:MAG: hypothetical protein M0R03_11445 [Novosphingobium sp.]|nr:hypothetical protein [Novosphingobium sp.]
MEEFDLNDLEEAIDVLIEDKEGFEILPAFGEVVTMTEKAVLLNFEEYGEKWIPKSVLRIDSDATIYVANWFYDKEF